jgi:hypothetical protein
MSKKRREKGEGSVYRRKDGRCVGVEYSPGLGLWRVLCALRPLPGKEQHE